MSECTKLWHRVKVIYLWNFIGTSSSANHVNVWIRSITAEFGVQIRPLDLKILDWGSKSWHFGPMRFESPNLKSVNFPKFKSRYPIRYGLRQKNDIPFARIWLYLFSLAEHLKQIRLRNAHLWSVVILSPSGWPIDWVDSRCAIGIESWSIQWNKCCK